MNAIRSGQVRRTSSATRAVSAVAALALAAGTAVAAAGPAAAATSVCGADVQNGLQVTPTHDSSLYVDIGNGFDASYLGYKVANSGAARTNLWVQVGSFTGGVVSLADATDDRQQIASLGAGATDTTFFLAKATATTATPQTHTVTVWDRRPDLAGAASLLTCTFTFGAATSTVQAAANKVTAISTSPLAPAIGQTVTVTVDGQTGTVAGAMWVSPAALSTWPSKALRLEGTQIQVNTDGAGAFEQTYTNTLIIPSNVASLYTSSTTYRATYTFRLTRPTASNPTVKPVAQIYSGGQFKHTGSYPTLPQLATSAAATAVAVDKSTTATDTSVLPTTTAPNGVSGATTFVEVPFTITATTAGGSSVIDEIVDVPASGVVFKSGSARLTDATPYSAAVIPDPVTSASDTGLRAGALHFTGPFYASVATPVTVSYVMYVPVTAGTYSNQAFASINGSVIGSSPSSVPIVQITTDGTGVSGVTDAEIGSGTSSQTITFAQPSGMTLPSSTQSLTASSSSGLAVTLTSSTPDVCTVSGTTVTSVSAGTCTLTAAQTGDATYTAAAPVTRSFAVSRAAQTISFTQPATMTVVAAAQPLEATATSGLAVSYRSTTEDVCTVVDGAVVPVSAGTCTLVASQDGDATYLAAADVTRTVTIGKAPQTIAFVQPDDMTYGGLGQTLDVASDSHLAVTVVSSDEAVCTVADGVVTATGGGTCVLTATQDGDAAYLAAEAVVRSFTVVVPGSEPQTITFAQPDDVVMTDSPFELAPTASSGLPVSLTSSTPEVCTVEGATVTVVGAGTCTLVAHQDGDATYAAALDVARSFTVARESQSITFVQHADVLMTATPFNVTASATSLLTVTIVSSTPEVCTIVDRTVTLVGAGTCTLTASQDGDTVYDAAADVERSFLVSRAPQTITFEQPAGITTTDSPQLAASSGSGLAVVLTSTTPEVCTVVDGVVTAVAAGDCTVVASQDGDATYDPAADVERTFAIALTPQTITADVAAAYSIPDSPVTLDVTAGSGLGVSLVSTTPEVCTADGVVVTLLSTGTCVLTASQPGDAIYSAADDVEISFAVRALDQTLAFEQPDDVQAGSGALALTVSSSSELAVAVTSLTPEICSVALVEGTWTATPLAVGECRLQADQAGDATYAPADAVVRAFDVLALPQTLSADAPADQLMTAGWVDVVTHLDTEGVVVLTSLTPDVCGIGEDGAVVLLAPGTCTVRAEAAAWGVYDAATPVEVSFAIALAPQSLDVDQPDDVVLGDGDVVLVVTASREGTAVVVSLTPDVCTVGDDGAVHLVGAGTCTISASDAGDGLYEPVGPVTRSFLVIPGLDAEAPVVPQSEPGDEISVAVQTSGGVGPYSYEVVDGDLPEGVVLDPATGEIAGAPAAPGTYTVTVLVTDADGRTDSVEIVLVVAATSELLPDMPDSAARMLAGTSWSADLPALPDGASWEVVAPTALDSAVVSSGRLVLHASSQRSGVHVVTVVASLGDAASTGRVTVTIVPQAPGAGTYRLRAGLTTAIAWAASPNASVRGYRVYVNGSLVARPTGRSVVLGRALGPRSVVVVRAVGESSVLSASRRAGYRAPARTASAPIGLDVHFATDSSALSSAARTALRSAARIAVKQGLTHLRLIGHTDSRGSYAYNLALSQRRAQAVRAYLAALAPSLRLTSVGVSEARPVAANTTPEGMARNRRVEVQMW